MVRTLQGKGGSFYAVSKDKNAPILAQKGESENRYSPPPTELIRQLLEALRNMAT